MWTNCASIKEKNRVNLQSSLNKLTRTCNQLSPEYQYEN